MQVRQLTSDTVGMSPRLLTIATRVGGGRVAAHIAFLLATLALAPAGASAAITNFSGTDPAGDGTAPAFDFTAGTATYDSTKGQFTVSLTTVGSPVGKNLLAGGFAGKLTGDTCDTTANDGSSVGWGDLVSANVPSQSAWGRPGTDFQGTMTVTRSANETTYVMGPDPGLVSPGADPMIKEIIPTCIVAQVQELAPDDSPQMTEEMTLLVTTAPTTTKGGADDTVKTKAPAPVVTTEPDADRDGIPDTADACPKVAGASAKGCPTIAANLEFRLGAKRVVVDRMVALTASSCPARVIAVVTTKGKRLGKGSLTVGQRGSFCHVTGVVRLTRRAKKVRIVGKATGMGSVVKSIRR